MNKFIHALKVVRSMRTKMASELWAFGSYLIQDRAFDTHVMAFEITEAATHVQNLPHHWH